MKIFSILKSVYGVKKDGNLKSYAVKFCEKHNLDINGDYECSQLILAFSNISNKDKKELALRMILDEMQEKSTNKEIDVQAVKESKKEIDIQILRQKDYKTCCRIFHPDNTNTGNENIFKFIQDVKMAFWDCDGKPKKDIEFYDWKKQKEARKKGANAFFF